MVTGIDAADEGDTTILPSVVLLLLLLLAVVVVGVPFSLL